MQMNQALKKLALVSMSGVMALSLCAPALTASANHRHHHIRRARRVRLTKRERRQLRKDSSKVRSIKNRIHRYEKYVHYDNAVALYRTMHSHGYSYAHAVAVLATIYQKTNGQYRNVGHHGYFGFPRAEAKALGKYAKRTKQSPSSVLTQLKFLQHGQRKFNKVKPSHAKSLFTAFNRLYLRALPASKKSRRAMINYSYEVADRTNKADARIAKAKTKHLAKLEAKKQHAEKAMAAQKSQAASSTGASTAKPAASASTSTAQASSASQSSNTNQPSDLVIFGK